MNCHACGTALSASARFCHKCGAAVNAPSQAVAAPVAGWKIGLPWGIAGAALGALVTVLAMRTGGGGRGGAEAGTSDLGGPFGGSGAPALGAAPDISQMSPEERATRLFNRVM